LSAATIAWPEWTQLGLTVTAVPSSSARASTVADNPALATSLMVGLQAAAARTVTIPAIRVQGTSGSAATEPLLVVIETSAPAAQPAVLVQPVGPQVRPGQLPFGPGPTPVPAAPSAGPPAQTVADNDRAGRLQMAIGAAAFYVLVAVVALVACRSWRRRAGRPPE
jgi:hypothetical protein